MHSSHSYASVAWDACTQCEPIVHKNNSMFSWQSSPQRKQYQLVVLLSWQSSPQRKQYQLVVLLSWQSSPQRKQYQLVVLLSWQSSPQRKQYQLVVLPSSLACWVLDLLFLFPAREQFSLWAGGDFFGRCRSVGFGFPHQLRELCAMWWLGSLDLWLGWSVHNRSAQRPRWFVWTWLPTVHGDSL